MAFLFPRIIVFLLFFGLCTGLSVTSTTMYSIAADAFFNAFLSGSLNGPVLVQCVFHPLDGFADGAFAYPAVAAYVFHRAVFAQVLQHHHQFVFNGQFRGTAAQPVHFFIFFLEYAHFFKCIRLYPVKPLECPFRILIILFFPSHPFILPFLGFSNKSNIVKNNDRDWKRELFKVIGGALLAFLYHDLLRQLILLIYTVLGFTGMILVFFRNILEEIVAGIIYPLNVE